jgi:DNA-binding IclR family transcriptional regulator
MVSHSEIINDILTLLAQAENRTLPFSSLLQTTALSRRELLSLLNSLEQSAFLSHTTDFWGDPQSYTFLVGAEKWSVQNENATSIIK